VDKGLGVHITDIHWVPYDDAGFYSRLYLFICELLYATGLYCGKMSILCFYWRLFRVASVKWPIIILMTMSTAWIAVRWFLGVFKCWPVNSFWDLNVGGGCSVEDGKFFIGTGITHVVIDIAILVLPVLQVRKLQLPHWQKVGISAMFMFGIL
jgi:hypothetical protein